MDKLQKENEQFIDEFRSFLTKHLETAPSKKCLEFGLHLLLDTVDMYWQNSKGECFEEIMMKLFESVLSIHKKTMRPESDGI